MENRIESPPLTPARARARLSRARPAESRGARARPGPGISGFRFQVSGALFNGLCLLTTLFLCSCLSDRTPEPGADASALDNSGIQADLTSEDSARGDSADHSDSGETAGLPLFAAPEGLAVMKDRLFVANTHASWNADAGKMQYETGFVSVFSLPDLSEIARLPLPMRNSQFLLPAGDRLAVVCSGVAAYNQESQLVPAEDGGAVFLDPLTLEFEVVVEIPAGQPDTLAGFPGSAAWSEAAAKLFVGSGTSPRVYVVDPQTEEISAQIPLDGPADENDLISVVSHEESVFAVSFNLGRLFTIDAISLALAPDPPLHVTESDDVEGPIDMAGRRSTE